MYKNLINRRHAVVGALGAVLQAPVLGQIQAGATAPLKVGFLYVAPLTKGGWVYQHDLGRLAVERALGKRVQTRYVENVPEGPDAERVLRDLAREGYGLIFTPSFGYMEPTLRVAAEFPGVKFESITGYKTATTVATANARYYEGRYLAGVAAAQVSATGTGGYVAGFPIPEVLQGINAFMLGMQSVRPKATTKVIFLNQWFDPAAERDAAVTLMNQGCDVLAYHTGSNSVMVAAQQAGKKAVAYHSDLRSIAPDAQILAVTHQWGDYYSQRTRAVLEGRWQSSQTWGGMAQGMVAAEHFGKGIAESVKTRVAKARTALVAGRSYVFSGPIVSNEGQQIAAPGQRLSDAQLGGMNYLVAGVESAKLSS